MNLGEASAAQRISHHYATSERTSVIPVYAVMEDDYPSWLEQCPDDSRAWLVFHHFKAKAGQFLLLPAAGKMPPVHGVLAILSSKDLVLPGVFGRMARQLPPGTYRLANDHTSLLKAESAALAWGLGAYRSPFAPKDTDPVPRPRWLGNAPKDLTALWLGRDLINAPANHLSPGNLLAVAREVVDTDSADPLLRKEIRIFTGKDLEQSFPLVANVAQASRPAGVLVAFVAGKKSAASGSTTKPFSLTLVGKGVTFDSGGLDIKPRHAMRLMKKDMGGAAHAISAFMLLRNLDLNIDLRLIIASADNGIGPEAFRPGDILTARNGTTVEVADTDAEGRLLLADALSYAAEGKPDLIVDFATLTGAARVALGTEIPNMFVSGPEWSERLVQASERTHDPLWPMPLWAGYRKDNHSHVADISNAPSSGYGGAITAALFLQHFLPSQQNWLHFDVMAWSLKATALNPGGGAIQGVRALVDAIKNVCQS